MVRETRHLWVGNLPHTIREERILDHFKRYGKVQSVKILPKKDEDSGTCATVAFIDIKSAAKAHNADNKIDERTLKTDYYEPPASSTASSAIFIHERDDTLVRPAPASYASGRSTRYQHGLSEDRNYERPGHYYERVPERESYLRRPIGMGYHDDDNYQGRAKSRDRYSRSTSGNTYTEGTERNQSHFRTHNARQHFDQQRYSVNDQYSEERDATTPSVRLNRRTNSSSASAVSSVASPPLPRSESRPRRVKRRSPSRSPSGSQSNSRSRSRSCSTSGSRSSSSSSKLQSSSSDSSGRSRSPSKSRSPAATYGSQNNTKGNRLDRPASAITNPSSSTCYLPSAVTSSAINCTSANSQGSIPSQGCISTSNENTCDKDDKRPLGICVRNLPVRSTDTSLKDGLFHEYKKHGKVTMVKVIGQGTERYAVVCFKKPEDVEKALEVSKDKLFFGCKIEVTAHEGLDAEDNEFRPLEAELDEFHPKATRTLFIGNLEKDITTTELRKHFDQFGEIIEIDIKKQGTATSYAFIQYSDIASVVKAMRKLDGENLGANRIKLGFGKSMPTNCVWLDGIVDGISEKFLARHFSRFGPVAYSAVDREKGHALVFYDSVEFAQIAVSEMRGRILGGKKLQVDFASRECQTTFFDKLEMTGQMVPGERPWERRERRGEFEIIRDDRDTRVGFENRTYTRYEGQSRAARGNFRGIQRAGFNGRGRGQGFSNRYEVYHDEFGERRHRNQDEEFNQGSGTSMEDSYEQELREYGFSQRERREYCSDERGNLARNFSPVRRQDASTVSPPPKENHDELCGSSLHSRTEKVSSWGDKIEDHLRERYVSRDESGTESTTFDTKAERVKYGESTECPNRKRNKLRNSISDPESHHSQSPPRSRHHSRSISPPCKERKALKDRLHHRIRSPSSHNSSQVNSPSGDPVLDEAGDVSADYRDLHHKCSDGKAELRDILSEITFPLASPIADCAHDGIDRVQPKNDSDSFRRCSVENENSDDGIATSDQLNQLDRKRRLLASSAGAAVNKDLGPLALKTNLECLKTKISTSHSSFSKTSKLNCSSDAPCEDIKSDTESGELLDEAVVEKPIPLEGANPDLKYLQKKQVHILHLLEQLREGVHSSDTEGSTDSDKVLNKKTKVSNSETSFCDNNINKMFTKEESASKTLKSGTKDNSLFSKGKLKPENMDSSNCVSLTLDALSLRKHLDPRKGYDAHTLSMASSNALQKCQRTTSEKGDIFIANSQVSGENFLCVSSAINTDLSWKKQCSSLNDILFPGDAEDTALAVIHTKNKDECSTDEILPTCKRHFQTASGLPLLPLEMPKPFISTRTYTETLTCHEIKREREVSPLSLPLPKFAASLRSPKASPNPLTSPKSSHSPRAGHSPSSFISCKALRASELLKDLQCEKKHKELTTDDQLNGISDLPVDFNVAFESPTEITEASSPLESIQSPKSNVVSSKDCNNSSDSESQAPSPNSQSIEERIKALDEKFNAWSGSSRTINNTMAETTPTVSDVPKSTVKIRSRFSFLTPELRTEPSEIVKSLLAKSTIFDQDSERLEHINEKYDPLPVKMEVSPKIKTTFRTKAAAKEFSPPIVPSLPAFNQVSHLKFLNSVTQGCMPSPPTPAITMTSSVVSSPVTPPTPIIPHTLLPLCTTPGSPPRNNPITTTTCSVKNISDALHVQQKDISELHCFPAKVSDGIKPKAELEISVGSCSVTLPSVPLKATACLQSASHSLLPNSVSSVVKKEIFSTKESLINLSWKDEPEIKHQTIKKEPVHTSSIPTRRDCTFISKDQTQFRDISFAESCKKDLHSKELLDRKDLIHFAIKEECNQWRENHSKDIKKETNELASDVVCSMDISEAFIMPASKKRVSSIDSNESDSGKSCKSLESSQESHDLVCIKQEPITLEPEMKRTKFISPSSKALERSPSPTLGVLRKCEKKDKGIKSEKYKLTNSSEKYKLSNFEKDEHDVKCNNKYEFKEKIKSENSKSKEDRKNKCRESKDSSKNEQKLKPKEGKGEKEIKSSHSSSSKNKKEPCTNKNEKHRNDKKSGEKSKSQKSKAKQDFLFFEEEPVYFSMYDKVKARSSQNQTLKHQAKDLETMRQKFSKLKQSRAKREEKSKSIDQDSDKESDSASRRSSESDTQAKSSKSKQQRKRKLVIESSSDDDLAPQRSHPRMNKADKGFSDSISDSECEYRSSRVGHVVGGSHHRSKVKKSELLETDSSGSDTNINMLCKTQIMGKKKAKLKHTSEKSKLKILKSDEDDSETEILSKFQAKDHKRKKIKKEKVLDTKLDNDVSDIDNIKKNQEELKLSKKKTQKDDKSEFDTIGPAGSLSKMDEVNKEKHISGSGKDKKTDHVFENLNPDDDGKHKSYNKKKKKSKKASKSKERRGLPEKSVLESCKKSTEEIDSKCNIPKLLSPKSPKPSSPCHEKPLSPPCLKAGILSDNDFKSDFSDFDFENNRPQDIDLNSDLWPQLETKVEAKISKKKDVHFSSLKHHLEPTHSEADQESSLPSFLEKIYDAAGSEIISESGCLEVESIVRSDSNKNSQFSSIKKEKDSVLETNLDNHQICKTDGVNDFLKCEENKACIDEFSYSKDDKKKRKSRKQHKEKRRKPKEEFALTKELSSVPTSIKPSIVFDSLPPDDDSRLSEIRLDEEIAEEARRLEQELLAASEETSTFGDDGPTKREEKPLERRFEEEAAKETRRLEEELFSTARESWHMKDKPFGSETHSSEICSSAKHEDSIDALTIKDENIFVGLELHPSSTVEPSESENQAFLVRQSDPEQYKLDDKDIDSTSDMESQRKLEDDLAVSALLQEMNNSEISAPELTKETDYLDPLMDSHPEDTMNYLLPDESDNSLHIAENSPDVQASESLDGKSEPGRIVISPSLNSEPPALEISNVEDPVHFKSCETDQFQFQTPADLSEEKVSDDPLVSTLDACEKGKPGLNESKPPVIDMPSAPISLDTLVVATPAKVNKFKKRHAEKQIRTVGKEDCQQNDTVDCDQNLEISDNQLSQFEDITMDNADSKDEDDNPPILQPVDSPRSHISSEKEDKNTTELMCEVKREKQDPNEIIATDSEKSVQKDVNFLSSDSENQKDSLNDIVNVLELSKEQNDENEGTDITKFNHSDNIIPNSTELSEVGNEIMNNKHELSDKTSNISEVKNENDDLVAPKTSSYSLKKDDSEVSVSIVKEDDIHLQNALNTSKLFSDPLPDENDLETQIGSCRSAADAIESQKNDVDLVSCSEPRMQLNDGPIPNFSCDHITNSDDYIRNRDIKVPDILICSEEKEIGSDSTITDDIEETGDISSLQFITRGKPEDCDINNIINNSETCKLDNNVNKDEHKDFVVAPKDHDTSLFHFPLENVQNDFKEKDHSCQTASLNSPQSTIENVTHKHENTVFQNEDQIIPDYGTLNSIPLCDLNGSQMVNPSKQDSTLEVEDPGYRKLQIGDVDSVSSDTIDATISDLKTEVEVDMSVNEEQIQEEQIQEELSTVDDADDKQKLERPRRGRRPKTRKYSESTISLPRYETSSVDFHSNPMIFKATPKRGRPQSSERARRSLRGDIFDQISSDAKCDLKHSSYETRGDSVVLNENDDVSEEISNPFVSDQISVETDNSAASAEVLGSAFNESDSKPLERSQQSKLEEPKRRGRRKKKTSGDLQSISLQCTEKLDLKHDELEHPKDFHRPKESRLWLSLAAEKEQKPSKENTSAYDVFEFRDSEDEELTFERDLQSSVKERLHENNRTSAFSFDQKHDIKSSDIVNDREKKVEENKQKTPLVEDKESGCKEHVPEVNQHRKISITIRLHQKDGHDGTSAGTAEVVKTSEALNIEDTKIDIPKAEKSASAKHEVVSSESPYNGPGKSTRKSTRLMNQAARSTVDEVIEEVIKGNFRSSSVEITPTRMTRRSRSNRRSEENIPSLPVEISEETVEEKNKNEAVFFIPDNLVKDGTDVKKNQNSTTETIPVSESTTTSEPDKITDRIASLRSFRITRSTANKLENCKENVQSSSSLVMSGGSNENESQKKEMATSLVTEEKQGNCIAVAQTSREHTKENTSVPSLPEIITSRPPLPVLKVELPRVVIPGSRELVNKEDNEDDSDSRSSPAVLIDPVTGFLTPVNKNGEPTVELLENNSLITSTEQKTRHEHNFSNTPSLCTSLITPLKGKASNPKDVSLSTPMEENLGSCKSSLDMSSIGRSSAPSSVVRGNPSESLLPLSTTASIPTTPSCISSTKNLVSPETALFLKCPAISEKDLDLSKATTKKPQTCTHVGVLTACNPVLSSPSTTAVSLISTSTKTVSSIATNVPSSNASVQPANLMGTLSYGWPQPSPSGGIPAFDRHIPQTMSPVVGKSSHPVVSVSPSSHQPTSRTIVTAVVTVASGIAATSMSSSVPKMQVKSATSTTVGLLQPTHLKSEVPLSHTTAVTRVETVCSTSGKSTITNSIVSSIHSQNISPNLDAPSSNAIVNTTWSSSKLGQCGRIPSNVVDTLPIHHSAVNVSNSTPSTSKLDVRLSQAPKSSHSHASKNNQSFLQQTGFSVPAYESSTHSGTHSIASTSNATGGVIAELLQNPQLLQQHKDYFAAASSNQFQERIQGQMVRPTTPVASGIPPDIATRLGNPTPPHTPTPPVTSSGHSLPPPEMHPAHVAAGLHLRHPSQSPLIVPIPPELNVYVHPQIMYAASHQHYAALHPDIRAQQEAQARAAAAMGISPRFAYPPIPPAAVSSSGFRQPPEPRLPHSSSNDIKLDIKSNSDLSKGVQEQRHMEEKIQHHPIKPIRIKKDDKEMKVIPSDSRADDTEVARSSSTHDKQSSSAAVAPQSVSLRPQHVHYPSAIRQLSPHLTVSPHERITDSPVVATLYATGQGRVPPIPIAGQLDDHKSEGTLLSQTHHLKADSSDRDMKPPIAHQALPSTLPYHTLEPPVHPTARQPLLGVPQVGSPAPGYVDNRSLNQSAHSPGSVSYKKEAVHLQANSMVSSLHTPSTEKRTNHEISKKVVHTRNLSHQGSSISPGPVGLSTAHSPLPWPPVIQSHNTHHSVAPSPSHSLHPPSEQPSRRNPPHATLQMGSDVPVHVPSSAHAMSQPTSIPRTLPQTPPHASQVPSHGDAFILQRYPVMWQGLLALKNDQAAVQMHFVSGNPRIARASLPPMAEGETSPVRIAQRMRLEQTQLEGVARKMQMMDEHCILMALPCGKDHMDVLQQSSNLKNGFINYLQLKQAAGIVNAAAPGTQQPAYVIHIFPSCDFSDNNLARIAPDLLHIICDITHLVIIIATV